MSKKKRSDGIKPLPKWVENLCITAVALFSCIVVITGYFVYANSVDWTVLRVIKYLILALMFLKILVFDFKYYSKKVIICLALVLICFTVSAFISDNRTLLQFFIVIVSAFRVDFKKLLKCFLVFEGGLFLLIILLAAFGVIPDLVFGRAGEFGVLRHSLGFRWCATPAIFGWSLSMAYLYYCGKEIKWWELLAIFIINIVLYALTDTRLEFACVILGIIASVVYKYKEKLMTGFVKETLRSLVIFLPIILTLLSFVLACTYTPTNDVMKKLDSWSSSRLKLSNLAVNEYSLKAFGNKTEWTGLSDIYEGAADDEDFKSVDNSYILIFLRYGLLVGIIVLMMYFVLGEWSVIRGDYLLEMMLFIIMLHSLFNPHLMTIPHNVFLLLIMPAMVHFADKPGELINRAKK
ncbi:hypothetical protein IKF23_02580 [Candidatus Saccharibacteria bacterium]|nr:hypothetical protein [Candidatus Saccharibacteria bacterium]